MIPAFFNHIELVCLHIVEDLLLSAWPLDFYGFGDGSLG